MSLQDRATFRMGQDEAEQVIQGALQAIEDGDAENLAMALDRIPIGDLSDEATERFLVDFIDQTIRYNRVDLLRQILSTWDDAVPRTQDEIGIVAWLFTRMAVPDEILSFLFRTDPTLTVIELLQEFIRSDSSDRYALGGMRAIQIGGMPKEETLRLLIDEAKDQKNAALFDMLTGQLAQISSFAPVPEWVVLDADLEEPPHLDYYELPEPGSTCVKVNSADQAVRLLMRGLRQFRILDPERLQDVRKAIRVSLQTAGADERAVLLHDHFKAEARTFATENDLKTFQLLGPVNALIGFDMSQDHKCSKWGGCRMFLCTHFEADLQDEDEEIDAELEKQEAVRALNATGKDIGDQWFIGHCEYCRRRIRSPVHAVRLPRPQGGWRGCYCSWEHVLESLGKDTQLERMLINHIRKQMEENGIADRIP